MKQKNTILFAIGLLGMAIAGAATVQDEFSAANVHYEAGRYQKALDLYLPLSRQLTNWKVFYNIGNCYFKLGRPLDAKISYLRARKLRPLDPSITRNISIVNKSFKDAIGSEPFDFLTRAIQVLQAGLSLNTLSLLLLAAIMLLNLFLFLLLQRGRHKRIVYGLAFSLVISLLLGAYLCARVDGLRQQATAVVSAENAVLRSGPGQDNTELFRIHPGLEVKILDRSRDWVQIAASSQVAGWIELKQLTLI